MGFFSRIFGKEKKRDSANSNIKDMNSSISGRQALQFTQNDKAGLLVGKTYNFQEKKEAQIKPEDISAICIFALGSEGTSEASEEQECIRLFQAKNKIMFEAISTGGYTEKIQKLYNKIKKMEIVKLMVADLANDIQNKSGTSSFVIQPCGTYNPNAPENSDFYVIITIYTPTTKEQILTDNPLLVNDTTISAAAPKFNYFEVPRPLGDGACSDNYHPKKH